MAVGDWACVCGQRYRVVIEDGLVVMWPESAAEEFREAPIGPTCLCGARVDPASVAGTIAGLATRVP